ncbi:MAG: response regulator [Deltaproteobacteria bacterium]|nr:response regulator [Deltaproteobacteria bacterium]
MGGQSIIRVLIVDDERAIRESFAACLRDYGLEAAGAASAKEALELLAVERFDVALVDVRLRETDGEKLIMQAHEVAPSTRFMIHTGSADYRPSKDLRSIGIGSEHILLKPQTDLPLLVQTILTLAIKGRDCDS